MKVYLPCPHCGRSIAVALRGARAMSKRPEYDWRRVDWTLPDVTIARSLGAAKTTVAEQRRKRAPRTKTPLARDLK